MAFSGETMPFIGFIDFKSKSGLYERLLEMNKKSAGLPEPDRAIVKEMTAAAAQEIAYCDERELLDFKRYLERRGKKRPPPKD
jgi:hypothetical protein